MPEGDQDNKDELFEDLDKFFAPIQDVEWPDPEAPSPSAPEARAGAAADEEALSAEAAPSPEDTITIPEAEPEEEPPADLVSTGREPPQAHEGAAASSAAHVAEDFDEIVVRAADETPSRPEASADEPPAGTPSEEHAAAEPIPGLADEVLGPDEAATEPSPEELEAAADHFASSVRDEDVDAGPADEPRPPETVTAPMDTLGDATIEPEVDAPAAPAASETEVEQSLLADLDEPETSQRTVVVGAAEGMGGPSWQEPTSVEVGSDQDRRGDTGRDVPAAFVTGLVLAAIALGSLAIGPGAFALVASIIALVAMGELYGVMHRRHLQPATAVGLVSGALVLAAAYVHGEAAMAAMLALGTLAAFLWFMTVPAAHRIHVTASVGVTILPVVYVAFLAGYALTTVALPQPFDGPRLVIDVIVLTFAYDAVAFAVGSAFGSRPLAQTISPKKSVEGSAAASVVVVGLSVVMAALFVPVLTGLARPIGLALVVAVFAPLGDLAESLLKRDLDVKDMGSILPGHGGVLDRIDSLLFVVPAAFLYFRIFL
jgi:phosphatidate cytidylyltransferase